MGTRLIFSPKLGVLLVKPLSLAGHRQQRRHATAAEANVQIWTGECRWHPPCQRQPQHRGDDGGAAAARPATSGFRAASLGRDVTSSRCCKGATTCAIGCGCRGLCCHRWCWRTTPSVTSASGNTASAAGYIIHRSGDDGIWIWIWIWIWTAHRSGDDCVGDKCAARTTAARTAASRATAARTAASRTAAAARTAASRTTAARTAAARTAASRATVACTAADRAAADRTAAARTAASRTAAARTAAARTAASRTDRKSVV